MSLIARSLLSIRRICRRIMSPARVIFISALWGKLKFIRGRTVVQIVRSIKPILPLPLPTPGSYGETFRYRNAYLKISIEHSCGDIVRARSLRKLITLRSTIVLRKHICRIAISQLGFPQSEIPTIINKIRYQILSDFQANLMRAMLLSIKQSQIFNRHSDRTDWI